MSCDLALLGCLLLLFVLRIIRALIPRTMYLKGLILLVLVVVWSATRPTEEAYKIGKSKNFGPIQENEMYGNLLARSQSINETLKWDEGGKSALPGYDDVLFLADGTHALVTAMDGWLWMVNLTNGKAEKYVQAPLMPSGLHEDPLDEDTVLFCSAVLHGEVYEDSERVGLYSLHLPTKSIVPLVLEVPSRTPPLPYEEGDGIVYGDADASVPSIPQSLLHVAGSTRPLAFCNDLEVSEDGKRVYFTEPIAYEGASMGGGAVVEAITLAPNGRLWRYDRTTRGTRLVASGFNFIDGVLTDLVGDDDEDQIENSVVVSQTVSFAITRFYLSGPRAGTAEVLWDDLPGMPDGLDRDTDGRIWSGLFKQRSNMLNHIHNNAWLKPLLTRLPLGLFPSQRVTGVACFSADASEMLYFSLYEGDVLASVASALPHKDRIYLANFEPDHTHGLVHMANPFALSPDA